MNGSVTRSGTMAYIAILRRTNEPPMIAAAMRGDRSL
jgi:hypothetical protein